MKKFIALLLLFSLLSGCAAETQPSSSESLPESSEALSSGESESLSEESVAGPFFERWSGFTDLSGQLLDLDGTAVKSFDLNYALGWNFDEEGYRKITIDSEVGGFPVGSISSSYYVSYNSDLTATAICSENSYYIGQIELMKGILKADGDGSEFYPYPNEAGNNFLFVCERTELEEEAFREASVIVLADGREVTVQPVPIGVGVSTEDGRKTPVTTAMLEELAGKTLVPDAQSSVVYLEVEIRFEPGSVYFYPLSDGEGGGIWDTVAVGAIESVEKDIILTDFS